MYPQQPRRVRVDTTDPDEAHEYLRQTCVDHAVHLDGSVERFRFRHELADGGRADDAPAGGDRPGAGATVAQVATRWGFAHHGRFAASYRREFGHTPGHDLHT